MGEIVSTITTALTSWISSLTSGISSAFSNLFLTADNKISSFGVYALTFLGIGVATGLVFMIVKMIRSR